MNNASWTKVLTALPDTAFFEIVRHYLGPLSTPFHKPELVDRMRRFFDRKDVVERVISFIDLQDALFLTFISFYEEPSEKSLRRLFKDIRYTALHEKLLNLEERLLIWSQIEKGIRRYALTPLGLMVKKAGLLGPGALIGEGVDVVESETCRWMVDNFLTASLSFLREGIPLFRKEGGWRKKSLELLKERFPLLFLDGRGIEKLALAGRCLLTTGMAVRKDDRLEPNLEIWREIKELSVEDRRAIMRARAAVGRSLPLAMGIKTTRLVCDYLPKGKAYSREVLARLLQLGVDGNIPLSPQGARKIIAHLELMGELTSCDDGLLSRSKENPPAKFQEMPCSITPVGDIVLKPNMPFSYNLAMTTKLLKADVATTLNLDKSCFLSGLDAGIDSTELFKDLEKYSSHPFPPNLRTLISEWAKAYRTISLCLGVILQAKDDKRQIIEETGILDSLSYSHPAPGIWVLDPADGQKWMAALNSIGIYKLPPLQNPFGIQMAKNRTPVSLPQWTSEYDDSPANEYNWKVPSMKDVSGFMAHLEQIAESASLSPEERATFKKRLKRRIILVPEQIQKNSLRHDFMSAKGLDYQGKLRLIEAALNGRDERLEITLTAGNSIKRVLVLPKRLEKEGNEHVLLALFPQDEHEVRYKIRKIGFLKRVKVSLL